MALPTQGTELIVEWAREAYLSRDKCSSEDQSSMPDLCGLGGLNHVSDCLPDCLHCMLEEEEDIAVTADITAQIFEPRPPQKIDGIT